ncbi:hypothetical protein CNE_BB2p03800 (plasmid) [Cupriavidus necator N-1]|uniref:Lipoprotein transmembrane n=1 Tax=Cupriavidus necator (strain ATCC 43291 / DSM 13513 / CCUG 52238 / LMG 8453 / N-1) TaxID=1042878 RepID=F8GY49_CUPNN|nr:hypothetical protein [Cupriavidus necator]AEI83173.1 hypothetical protein CNE_BB2p03800 [Cupriavidus necator N-1]MDX6008585.1 hypothetical protein [Cupriavidus necator]
MKTTLKLGLSAISLATLLALAACGGGGGGDETPAGAPATTPPSAPTPTITVQGSAPAVSADPLAVVFVPQTETSTRSVLQSIASNAFPAQFQKAPNDGAYTQLGIDASSLITLNGGTVADVAGNGDFAIGRWTNGSNSIGSISANQGAHYVVGKPLALVRTPGPTAKLTCTYLSGTRPTSVSGNFTPGSVNSATATIDLNGPALDSFMIDVNIGADAHAASTATGTTISGVLQASGVLHHVQVMGNDPNKPYLAIGYAMPTPSSGDVTGVVVMKCQ